MRQLRDYGYDGQWGLEPSFIEYLENLWTMMDEVYRVLKPSGTCWINLGDTYARGSRGKDGANHSLVSKSNEIIEPRTSPDYNGLDKCLLLIPHRFAIGCIERGWIIRNDIIWAKRNGMPESTKDRFSKKHEYFFFMVKNTKYFFNLDAIRDKHKTIDDLERRQQNGVSEWKTQMASDTYAINGTGKNPGDISDFWDINTKPSSNNHYAGYNEELIRKPILAGCPEFVCIKCGVPRTNISELSNCGCKAGFEGGIIYDPFMGTGSTAESTIRANRNFIGSEMSKDYCEIANKRLEPFLLQTKLF